ncbi:MAG TPA: FAD-binding oxidoreductase, partial [Candidatus Nanopelagicales bacterium]|nr:FAD-binding oxidoreductase [Candidatus Nanopelagicales bacterium]
VIDISRMKGARVDPARQTVRAQAGLTWSELDRETQAFGLATTGGQCSGTGIAGVTLGGGIGWLMRRHGLTIDNLLSIDLVTADGRFVTASEHENQELFWGLRGGGGNFGIVTELELRLHPVQQMVVAIQIYPAERLADALRVYQDFAAKEPDGLSSSIIFIELPELPLLPDHLRGTAGVVLASAYDGPPEEAATLLEPLRALGPPAAEIFTPLPYLVLQSMFDASPVGAYGYGQCIRSSYMNRLDDATIDAVVAQMRVAPSPLCLFEMAHIEGAVAQVPEDSTAFPRRAAPFFSMFQATWRDPVDAERYTRWTEDAWQSLERSSYGGTHLGFIDAGEPESRIREAFGEAKMARLTALKRAWDPENFFRMNKNIRP